MGAQKELIDLLVYIKEHGHVGIHSIEIVLVCLEQQLIQHTDQGNFELTDKGRHILGGTPDEIV